jgi:hypothetical protein
MFPETSAQVRPIAAPVMGLAPTFPVIFEEGTSVMPDFDKMANAPAVPRLTGNKELVAAVTGGRTE